MKSIFAYHLTIGMCLVLGGCMKQEDADVQVEDVRAKFVNLRDSLNAGYPFARNMYDAAAKIGGWINSVSNASLRTDLSLELSEVVLSVELTNQPYLVTNRVDGRCEQRLFVVDSYRDYIIATFWIMNENGCQPKTTMDFFFDALQKYKEASFSVPLDWNPLPGEGRELWRARHNAAGSLYDFYGYCMVFIRRVILPQLSDRLPVEYHDEFRRRLEPFFDFPSKEEFYPRLYPGWKNLPSLPSEQKQETTKPDDAVEVDI